MGSKANRNAFMSGFWWKEPIGIRPKKDRKHAQGDTAEEVQLKAKQDSDPFVLGGEGLRYHLTRIQEGKREPAIRWTEAVARFQKVQKAEHQCRSEEHTSELQSLMRISYAVFCLKKKTQTN